VRLYSYFRSSAAYRVRIALNLKSLTYEMIPVHLVKGGGQNKTPEYRAINPQMRVPALALSDSDVLVQSLAIIEWLDERYPTPRLVPSDAFERARVRSIAYLIACEIHPLNNLRVLQHLKHALGQSEEGINAWYKHWIADGLSKVEAELARPATGKFSHGDAPSLADCCLVPQIFNAKRYSSDLAPYPSTLRVFEECMKLEAFDRAQPSKQPDAE
jgi:maleylacetoacetate isomerase